jgi:hypothetical protein
MLFKKLATSFTRSLIVRITLACAAVIPVVTTGGSGLGGNPMLISYGSYVFPPVIGAQFVRPDITQSCSAAFARKCRMSHNPPTSNTTTNTTATSGPRRESGSSKSLFSILLAYSTC